MTRTRFHRGNAQWSDTTLLTPSRAEAILDKNKIATGLRYYYALPTNAGVYRATAKGLHITADQIFIPMKKNVEHKVSLDKSDPEWHKPTNPRALGRNVKTTTTLDTMWVRSKAVQFSVS